MSLNPEPSIPLEEYPKEVLVDLIRHFLKENQKLTATASDFDFLVMVMQRKIVTDFMQQYDMKVQGQRLSERYKTGN